MERGRVAAEREEVAIMEMAVVSPVLAVLSVVAVTGSLLILGAVGAPGAVGLRRLVLERGQWMALAVATTATLGSLYYSEVAGLPPCEFCWFQRIFMYPLAVVLLIGSVRRDEGVWKYAVTLAAIGLLFSLYHYQLEAFPEQKTFCTSAVPCSVRLVNEFGFISIAFMAGAGFTSVLALAGARRRALRIEA